MTNKFCILVTALLSVSCSSGSMRSEPQKRQISMNQMEALKLGEPIDEVLKVIGAPEKKMMNDGTPLWIYRDATNGYQRVALGLDSDSRSLRNKTILLNEADAESKVDYLLKEKFRSLQFREVRFPQCGKDFVSGDALFVADAEGISIRFSKSQRVASAISWSSPEELRQDVQNVLTCQGRR